jgi:transcriptional regulator with XRE-family HTH domain
MPARFSPTVRRRRLGMELRRLREHADKTIEQVAAHLECSDSKISRLETGHVGVTPRDVRDMLEFYEVGGEERDYLIELARETRKKEEGWWLRGEYSDLPQAFAAMEAEASTIRAYSLIVPGLFQTESYMREIFRPIFPGQPKEIERRVEFRLGRQAVLTKAEPPNLRVVLDEAALHRMVGGPKVMQEQVDHLIKTAQLPSVTLQVLRFDIGSHAGVDGNFSMFQFLDQTYPEVAHLEHTTSDLYLEDSKSIQQYADIFERLCMEAVDPEGTIIFLSEVTARLQKAED